MGKVIKHNFAFCAAVDAGEKANFEEILNFKYFVRTVKLLRPHNFPSFPCGPEGSYGPLWESLV
jgi:hypothetical protein